MSDSDVMKVSLDNLHNLLKKIEENQTRLFDTQNEHTKEVERLNGLIEKNISNTCLELKALNREIQTNADKHVILSEEVKNIKHAHIGKLDEKLEKLRYHIAEENEKLLKQVHDNLEELVDKIDLNTEFRQNMTGFSWVRHGIPVLMFLIAAATLAYTILR